MYETITLLHNPWSIQKQELQSQPLKWEIPIALIKVAAFKCWSRPGTIEFIKNTKLMFKGTRITTLVNRTTIQTILSQNFEPFGKLAYSIISWILSFIGLQCPFSTFQCPSVTLSCIGHQFPKGHLCSSQPSQLHADVA